MKDLYLYNTAHPLAESGKPIFIPFGEWRYDDARRQRLDRAHGERIANELNERVAKGEPGIPVYQGHPDVPELASKYPDKGALGWVTKIELVNEARDGASGGPGPHPRQGLNLYVEWDRDPGKGFRWFSPYWLANEREGSTYIVGKIASIGLVNNPNIKEFRLANEEQTMKTKKLNPAIIELAAKYDRLANEANFDESKHPRADDGKFTSGGGGSGKASRTDKLDSAKTKGHQMLSRGAFGKGSRAEVLSGINNALKDARAEIKYKPAPGTVPYEREARKMAIDKRRGVHAAAILAGYRYNRATHQYE